MWTCGVFNRLSEFTGGHPVLPIEQTKQNVFFRMEQNHYSENSILHSLNLHIPWIYAIRPVLKFPWIYVFSLLCFLWLCIWILKSCQQKLPWFDTHFHSWSFGPAKLASKTCAACIARLNLAKPSRTIFVWTLVGKGSAELFSVQRSL